MCLTCGANGEHKIGWGWSAVSWCGAGTDRRTPIVGRRSSDADRRTPIVGRGCVAGWPAGGAGVAGDGVAGGGRRGGGGGGPPPPGGVGQVLGGGGCWGGWGGRGGRGGRRRGGLWRGGV